MILTHDVTQAVTIKTFQQRSYTMINVLFLLLCYHVECVDVKLPPQMFLTKIDDFHKLKLKLTDVKWHIIRIFFSENIKRTAWMEVLQLKWWIQPFETKTNQQKRKFSINAMISC